jgi:hypothetical protein
MSTIVSRLDITQIFCDVDDLCKQWENLSSQVPQLPSTTGERRSTSRMHLSEVMTVVIAFHGSGYKTFKEFYTLDVLTRWHKAFPNARQLHSVCGIDALVLNVVMLLFTYTYRGNYRD